MSRELRFGIAIIASQPPDEFIKTVVLAEDLGFDSVWIPDYRLYRDVYVYLALAALNTSQVRLGCAVTNPYTRHPAMTAVGIASVDEISNGRMVLGLGPGGVVLNLLDIERRYPVETCREAIEHIRRYLGSASRSSRKAQAQLDFSARADLPIFIAATGRRMLTLAGEVADGVIVNVGSHENCVEKALAAVANGAWGVKRKRDKMEMLCWLQGFAISEKPAEALKAVKPTAALTISYAPLWMLEAMDIDVRDVSPIREAYEKEGAQSAAELVTDEMVNKYSVAGSPEQVIRKIKRLRAHGFDEIILLPAEGGADIRPMMRNVSETVMSELRSS